MQRFRFALRGVLQYRTALEEQSKQKLAISLDVLRQHQLRMDEFRTELDLSQQPYGTGRLDVARALLRDDYLAVMETAVCKQAETVASAEGDVARRQDEVVQAMQQRKVLENLHTRRRTEYDDMLRRAEQKDLDEINSAAFVRRQGRD